MVKAANLPLANTRALSIREIVHNWRREAVFHPKTLERELRRFHLNAGLNWRGGERIDPLTPDEDLPPADTLVDKNWLTLFCEKKGYALPAFWFPPDPAERRRPGRPSIKSAIVQEFDERCASGSVLRSLIQEAAAIKDSLEAKEIANVPQAKTIAGHIRKKFKAQKTER